MSRKCAACQHPDIADINAQLVEGGVSNRALSRKFIISEDSLSRHRKNHLPKFEVQRRAESHQYDHFRKLKLLEQTLFSVLKRRFKDEDDGMVLRAHGQLLRHYEFEVRLGELAEIKAEIEELRETIKEREDMR